jgi:hypothetical protein
MYSAHVDKLLTKRGQIVTLTTRRNMKVRKGQEPIIKESLFQCRVGVNYDNINAVKERREDGRLPEVNQGLPWGTWVEFPYVIEHKGEYYVRCTVVRNNHPGYVKFYRGTEEITREQARVACLASEFNERSDDDIVFNIRAGSIVSVS